jgi:hypothetical protein
LFIRQSLSTRASDCAAGAFGIVNTELDTVRIAKIKLVQIFLQVLLRTMLVNADHAALEDAEEAFNGVRCD